MIQFLACNSDLGTCCSDYALASFLDVSRRIVEFIQMIAPILLLIMATIQLVQLMVNPDVKDGRKKLYHKFQAAAIIFFVPIIVNAFINLLPVDFTLSACWKTAKTMRELSKATPQKYIALSDQKASTLIQNPDDYESGNPSGVGSIGDAGDGALRIIKVALAELGNHEKDRSHHKYEVYNKLSDDTPWCAAFVTWCAGEAGYLDKGIFPRFVGCSNGYREFKKLGADIHLARSGYTPQAGDIIFFSWKGTSELNHVGIVLSADSENVYTIEGNTKCEGETVSLCEGTDGVSKKTRPRNSTIYAYVTPHYTS